MELKNDTLGARLVVPDTVTVRQQLLYFSAVTGTRDEFMARLWEGARTLILEWECPALPDRDVSLDEISSTKATEVIIWAALAVKNYINGLDNIPKNS